MLSGVYGCSVALLQLTLYGTAGASAKLSAALMVGNGLSSILINLLRIFVLIFIEEVNIGCIFYFVITALFMFYCSYVTNKFINLQNKTQREQILVAHNSQIKESLINTSNHVNSEKFGQN